MQLDELRVVSLNTWADCTGKIVEDVIRLKEGAHVLCFQEVHRAPAHVPTHVTPRDKGKRTGYINTKLFDHIATALGDEFVGYFAPQMRGYLHDMEASEYPEIEYGNAMFVRKEIPHTYRDSFIYGYLGKTFDAASGTPAGKTGQAIDIHDADGVITVAHVHGAWFKSDKTSDFSWRNEQAAGILRLMAANYDHLDTIARDDNYRPRAILVGDLNVVTATKTVKLITSSVVFSRVGGWHLNARNGVWRTRTSHYTGDIMEADHAFASHELNATLTIDDTVNSDHAALIVHAKMRAGAT